MLIVITGKMGVGKTGVCRRVIDLSFDQVRAFGGILSYKVPPSSIVVEDVQTSKQMVLAGAVNTYDGPTTGKYSFNPKGIAFGLEAIEKAKHLPMLIVDELGPLELSGSGFAPVINMIKEKSDQTQMVVIRDELLSSFLPLFDQQRHIFQVDYNNRNQVPIEISRLITSSLQKE